MERPNAWLSYDAQALAALEETSKNYRHFLDNGKTERECVAQAVAAAQKQGYVDLQDAIRAGKQLQPGDKVYVNVMGKAVMLFLLGRQPLEQGVNIVGAHIDSPRIDVKQNPFYEDTDIAYADTHYYGGIKKYQWTTVPLALHGVSEGESRERLTKLADYLEVTDVLDKFPAQMSGGQKQRIAAARALILDPEIVLADEPTGALDSRATDELLRVFSDISAGGQTILMVTHSVRAASRAGRVLFIKDGEVCHQLYRGGMTDDQLYQKITDALTVLQAGGERV